MAKWMYVRRSDNLWLTIPPPTVYMKSSLHNWLPFVLPQSYLLPLTVSRSTEASGFRYRYITCGVIVCTYIPSHTYRISCHTYITFVLRVAIYVFHSIDIWGIVCTIYGNFCFLLYNKKNFHMSLWYLQIFFAISFSLSKHLIFITLQSG